MSTVGSLRSPHACRTAPRPRDIQAFRNDRTTATECPRRRVAPICLGGSLVVCQASIANEFPGSAVPCPGCLPLSPCHQKKLPSAWRPNGPAAHRCSGELMGWDRQGGRALARAPWHVVSRARSPHGVAVVTALATAGDGLCGPKPSSTHPGRGQGSSPAQSPMARRPRPSPAAAQRNPCAGT